jgi:hypothetical protein
MPITLARSGNSALRRDRTQPSDDRSWQQASHFPARSWRVSERVIDTLAKGFGIRPIRTDPPESVDRGRCRALVKSQPGGSGHRLAQRPFSGFVEPRGCDGDAPRPEARPTADPEPSSSTKAPVRSTQSRPKKETPCQIHGPHDNEPTEPQTRNRAASNAPSAQPPQSHTHVQQVDGCLHVDIGPCDGRRPEHLGEA